MEPGAARVGGTFAVPGGVVVDEEVGDGQMRRQAGGAVVGAVVVAVVGGTVVAVVGGEVVAVVVGTVAAVVGAVDEPVAAPAAAAGTSNRTRAITRTVGREGGWGIVFGRAAKSAGPILPQWTHRTDPDLCRSSVMTLAL